MGLSRNQRRKLRKERLAAKSERIAKAALAARQDEVKAIVRRNLNEPQAKEVAYNPLTGRRELQGTLGSLGSRMHGATEAVKDATPYRRMALERWITSKPKSHSKK